VSWQETQCPKQGLTSGAGSLSPWGAPGLAGGRLEVLSPCSLPLLGQKFTSRLQKRARTVPLWLGSEPRRGLVSSLAPSSGSGHGGCRRGREGQGPTHTHRCTNTHRKMKIGVKKEEKSSATLPRDGVPPWPHLRPTLRSPAAR